jgi:hypothetical protein
MATTFFFTVDIPKITPPAPLIQTSTQRVGYEMTQGLRQQFYGNFVSNMPAMMGPNEKNKIHNNNNIRRIRNDHTLSL